MSKDRVKKTILIVSFSGKKVQYEFVTEKQTVNGNYYLEVVQRLKS